MNFSGIKGFEWDEWNVQKNWEKHKVRPEECEEAFFNRALVAFDEKHSQEEDRYYLLGETNSGRKLFIVFTIRGDKIRIISARDMSRKERKVYERIKKDSKIQE